MDLKRERREIRQKYFPIQGLLIVSGLGGLGLFMLYLSDVLSIKSFNMLYELIYKNGVIIIFGTFFLILALYIWLSFFINTVLSPKKEVLYLASIDYGELQFLNKKGKKFSYDLESTNLVENTCYYVLKTHNYIYKVLEKSDKTWIAKEKRSYWLNYYSPAGSFEDILLLPIAYVILLPGLISIFMAKGYTKIFGILFSVIPLYVIIYDLIYKIKLNKEDKNEFNEGKR